MSKLNQVSLSEFDAVATAVKTWLSKWVDLSELTPFDDEALGMAAVEALGERLGDRWHPWPDEVPPAELDGEWLLVTLHVENGHDFVMHCRWVDGHWNNTSYSRVMAWMRNPAEYRRTV